jgi:hypothetical protein
MEKAGHADVILFLHALFGVMGTLAGVWVFIELLNISDKNVSRLNRASVAVVGFMWLSFFLGGYWYVCFYGPDKALINAGPWPWAHGFFMEAKEHLFFQLLLLAMYLRVLVMDSRLTIDGTARKLALAVSGLVVVFGVLMERFGAVIVMGLRAALALR